MDTSFQRHKIITQITILEVAQTKAMESQDFKTVNEIAQTIKSLLHYYQYGE